MSPSWLHIHKSVCLCHLYRLYFYQKRPFVDSLGSQQILNSHRRQYTVKSEPLQIGVMNSGILEELSNP